jgi:hypothetical protein
VSDDRLDFLLRRFRQLVPEPLTGPSPVVVRQLGCWLRDDVAPVLAGYVRRQRFRDQAAWPVRQLAPGSGTPERHLVEAADAALVGYAGVLRTWVRKPAVRKRLEAVAREPTVVAEEALVGNGPARLVRRRIEPLSRLPSLTAAVDHIAGRFWTDLVCPADYFEPLGGWMTATPAAGRPGEFVVALNPELHPGGDFVSRCLCRRVEVLAEVLDSLFGLCGRAFPAPAPPPPWFAEVGQAQRRLRGPARRLRQTCLQGEDQPLRDACVLLTQVHAAVQPEPDLGWLGLEDAAIHRGAMGIGYRLLQRCDGELLERVAGALGELRRLYAGCDRRTGAVDEAVATGGLVLVRESQEVFWQGRRIAVAWGRCPSQWRFLSAVVAKGQRGAAVAERDLYEDAMSASTVGNVFARLKQQLPPTLWGRIVPSRDPRGYRLTLDRHQIHVF